MDWLDLLAVQETLERLLQHHTDDQICKKIQAWWTQVEGVASGAEMGSGHAPPRRAQLTSVAPKVGVASLVSS